MIAAVVGNLAEVPPTDSVPFGFPMSWFVLMIGSFVELILIYEELLLDDNLLIGVELAEDVDVP